MLKLAFFLALLFTLSCTAQACAQWGDLRIQFRVAGEVPPAEKLHVTKGKCCLDNADKLIDESLVVSKQGGLANVVVWLESPDKEVPVHESFAEAAKDEVVLKVENCRFEPHVIAVRTSQKLLVKNLDPIGHGAHMHPMNNQGFSPNIPTGTLQQAAFTKAEKTPFDVFCRIHPWMSAWLIVQDHPYVGVSDVNGNVQIKNIPAGEWTFRVWHERQGLVKKATIEGKEVEWKSGRFVAKIREQETTDLGTVTLLPEQVAKPK